MDIPYLIFWFRQSEIRLWRSMSTVQSQMRETRRLLWKRTVWPEGDIYSELCWCLRKTSNTVLSTALNMVAGRYELCNDSLCRYRGKIRGQIQRLHHGVQKLCENHQGKRCFLWAGRFLCSWMISVLFRRNKWSDYLWTLMFCDGRFPITWRIGGNSAKEPISIVETLEKTVTVKADSKKAPRG